MKLIVLKCTSYYSIIKLWTLVNEPPYDKTNKMTVCPAKTQISLLPIERTAKTLIILGRCPGWSESSRAHSRIVGFVMRWLKCYLSIENNGCTNCLSKSCDKPVHGWLWLCWDSVSIPDSVSSRYSVLLLYLDMRFWTRVFGLYNRIGDCRWSKIWQNCEMFLRRQVSSHQSSTQGICKRN